MNNTLHKNENYCVIVEGGEYNVINTKTDIVEHTTQSLPEAINFAEHSDVYLKMEHWRWIRESVGQENTLADLFSGLADLADEDDDTPSSLN